MSEQETHVVSEVDDDKAVIQANKHLRGVVSAYGWWERIVRSGDDVVMNHSRIHEGKQVYKARKRYRIIELKPVPVPSPRADDFRVVCLAEDREVGTFSTNDFDLLIRSNVVVWESIDHQRARYAVENREHPRLRDAPMSWWVKISKQANRPRGVIFPPLRYNDAI